MLQKHLLSVLKKQKEWCSGKKKRHTIKTQIVVDKKTQKILCATTSKGSVHDFKVYKNSIGYAISNDKKVLTDSGYQGIHKFHLNSYIPKKKSKNHALTDTEIDDNRKISKERILIENINAKIKVFKILSDKYRNRGRRFGLRMSLFCGVINFELSV